jgi:hypothetical protein
MEDQRLERIENKLDKAAEHLSSIDSTLAAQHVSLKEHIRRTAILEIEMKPVKNHVAVVNGILKLVGLIAAIGGGIEGVVALAKYLGNGQ